MATLTGQTIASTYDALLKVTDNGPITSSLKLITDGLGNNTALSLSNAGGLITGTFSVSSTISASNLSGTNTGDETLASIKTKLGAASATQDGYLTLTDWSTFNSKQSALTNPITGTGTTNTLPKFTGTSALGNSNITDSGTLISLGSNTTISSGGLGIGTSTLTGYNVNITKNITGATTSYGINIGSSIQSDVTTAYIYRSAVGQAAGGTLTELTHFLTSGQTFSGTVTSQYGFNAGFGLTGGTNNYAFFSGLAAASGRWNLYMSGTANNYMAGALGIGTTTLTGINLSIGRTLTGSVTSRGILQSYAVASDVTNAAIIYGTSISTQAATFTLPQLTHYSASQVTIGVGSTVTNQNGFRVDNTLVGATNNYAFKGEIPAAANRWNLYMDGTANNYLAGSLGIGSTSLTGFNVRIGKSLTGSTSMRGIYQESVIQSDVTALAAYNTTYVGTQAAAFTLTNIYHYEAVQGVFGASSAVTNQNGFRVDSSLIGATNNYGFRGLIPSGTGRWNLYMDGTAGNHLAGDLAIGTTTLTAIGGHSGILTLFGSNATALSLQDSVGRKDIRLNDGNLDITNSAGTSHLYIANAGNVLMGSTTDNGSGAKLQVTGNVSFQNIFNRRTASYTLALTDQNDIIEMNVASANNLTVPLNSSVAFPIGTEIAIMQYGAGQTTIVATSGVTLRAKSNALKISGQYAGCTLVKVGTDEWYVVGDLTV